MSSSSNDDDDELPTVNSRVETLDGNRGFCRYIGSVDGQTGTWVGVEWDDQKRGKHDGKHNGKRYFECKRGKEAGGGGGEEEEEEEEEDARASFVRVQKVATATDFVSAAKEKYELENQEQGLIQIKQNGFNRNTLRQHLLQN